jgi:predicted acetyltransferase
MDHATTDVTIAPAAAGDIRDVAALWCQAFPGPRTVAERVRMLETGGRYGGLDTVLVARDGDGALVGACKIYPMRQRLAGAAMPMMGLAAVAVAQEARRHGVGAQICQRAMETARDRGDVISTLYPFRVDYYQRLGWGLVGELHDYRFATAALPADDGARHVRPARGAADADAIAACYDRAISPATGPIDRDARVWGYRLAGEEVGTRPLEKPVSGTGTGGGVQLGEDVIVYDRGRVAGYALLRRVSRKPPRDGVLHIRELVAESDEAYRGILAYLAGLGDRWPVGRYAARPDERFGHRLPDPRRHGASSGRSLYFPTARILLGPMLRVLDVPRALALRPYFDGAPEGAPRRVTLELRIEDRQLPENRGPWIVRIDGGRGTVEPGDDAPAAAAAASSAAGSEPAGRSHVRVETDAPTFARLFAGELSPGQAAASGDAVIGGDAALLADLFATRHRFWLLDEF